jgi:hypothetical protein
LCGRKVNVPNGSRKDRNYDLWGWLLFVISALFFVVSSIRNGDIIGLLGGIFFLLACLAFLTSYSTLTSIKRKLSFVDGACGGAPASFIIPVSF